MLENKIEVFDKEVDLFFRIEELRNLGFKEEDMYIIVNDEDDVSMLRGLTDIIITEEKPSIISRFKSFLKGEDSIFDAFSRIELDETERDFFYSQIKKGKILLIVDKDYYKGYELAENGLYTPVNLEDNKTPDNIDSSNLDSAEQLPDHIKIDIGLNPDDPNMKSKASPINQTIENLMEDEYRN